MKQTQFIKQNFSNKIYKVMKAAFLPQKNQHNGINEVLGKQGGLALNNRYL